MVLYGFGMKDINNIDWRKVASMLNDFDSDHYKCLVEDTDNLETEEAIKEWFSNYDSEGYQGIGAFLYDYMTKEENIQFSIDDPNGIFIGISAGAPWEFSGDIKDMSEEQFANLLRKYIKKITDEDVPIRWWNIDDGQEW